MPQPNTASPGAEGIPSPRPTPPSTPPALPLTRPDTHTKILLVEFRSGEAVCHHPDVVPLLAEGWVVKSAVPRVVENEGARLLVVLTQEARRF